MAKKKKTKKKTKRKAKRKEPWFLYVLECEDHTLYTGIAKDVEKRFEMHATGKGAKYTRGHKPLRILYTEKQKNVGDAMRRERAVKKMSRPVKFETLDISCPKIKRRRKKKAA